MDDFEDRTISELMESYPLFVDTLKEEFDALANMIDIVFSSCSIITKTEKISRGDRVIECKIFPSFFEYQIYKIIEKYRYYNKIRNQFNIIKNIYYSLRYDDPKLNDINIPCDISKGLYVLNYSFKTQEFKIFAGDR